MTTDLNTPGLVTVNPAGLYLLLVAKEHHVTISRALVTLAEREVRAEGDAKEKLKTAYRGFLKEQEPSKKEEAGKNMIWAVFGKDAIADLQRLPVSVKAEPHAPDGDSFKDFGPFTRCGTGGFPKLIATRHFSRRPCETSCFSAVCQVGADSQTRR